MGLVGGVIQRRLCDEAIKKPKRLRSAHLATRAGILKHRKLVRKKIVENRRSDKCKRRSAEARCHVAFARNLEAQLRDSLPAFVDEAMALLARILLL